VRTPLRRRPHFSRSSNRVWPTPAATGPSSASRRLGFGEGDGAALEDQARAWEELGATHLSLNTMYGGFETPQDHLRAIESFAKVIGLTP